MMLSKGSCCCILHLLHRVGSTNLFAYRNVIKKWTIRVFGTKVRERLILLSSVFPCCISATSQNRGKHFLVTLSVFPSGMKKVASSLLLVRGNAKLEMEEGEKRIKVPRESKEKV